MADYYIEQINADSSSAMFSPVLKISEIFLSVQGEGVEQGNPTIFIRLFGCNLNCKFCDTDYAKEGDYQEMTIEEIVEEIRKYYPYYYVHLTGGEPLLQAEAENLVDELIYRQNKTVWIDTNGSQDIEKYTQKGDRCKIVLDIKCPSSGMTDKMLWRNFKWLRKIDQIKYVIATNEDYEFAKSQARVLSYFVPAQILFSPAFAVKKKFKPVLTPADIVEKMKKDKLFVRLSLQIHKIIYDPEERGV